LKIPEKAFALSKDCSDSPWTTRSFWFLSFSSSTWPSKIFLIRHLPPYPDSFLCELHEFGAGGWPRYCTIQASSTGLLREGSY
jgi:hypothetical protein